MSSVRLHVQSPRDKLVALPNLGFCSFPGDLGLNAQIIITSSIFNDYILQEYVRRRNALPPVKPSYKSLATGFSQKGLRSQVVNGYSLTRNRYCEDTVILQYIYRPFDWRQKDKE